MIISVASRFQLNDVFIGSRQPNTCAEMYLVRYGTSFPSRHPIEVL